MSVFFALTNGLGRLPGQLTGQSKGQSAGHFGRQACVVVLGLGLGAVSHAATYEIDPTHANVRFAIDHFGTSTNTGGFYNLSGEVVYDPKARQGQVTIEIPMATLNTGNAEFDKNLKGKDFFEVEKYPTATFVSTQWYFKDMPEHNSVLHRQKDKEQNKAAQGAGMAVSQVAGNLTMHGETHPVTLTATKFNCYFSPILLKSVCGGDFTTTIDRTQWGISKYVLLGMTKNVELKIQIEAAKK